MRLDRERLQDILDAINAIERYASAGRAEFDRSELVQVWCLRHIEIIGEAASKLSADVRATSPDVPWPAIVGMRNAVIHGYFDVNWERVWGAVVTDLPSLKSRVEGLLASLESDESP